MFLIIHDVARPPSETTKKLAHRPPLMDIDAPVCLLTHGHQFHHKNEEGARLQHLFTRHASRRLLRTREAGGGDQNVWNKTGLILRSRKAGHALALFPGHHKGTNSG